MTQTFRFGIVGAGIIGRTHAEAIQSLPDAELVAVTDADPARARALAEKYGAQAYTDLGEMLQREQLDVVTIGTPSGMHGDQACQVMRSGRHVIVEKPMDIRLPVIDDMLRVQREAGVKLAVISQRRFDPSTQRVHRLIQEGALGTLVLGTAHVLWWRSQAYYDSAGWRGTWAMDGGGILMNQSIHSIDLLTWLMGPVERIKAYTDTLAHRMETEDTAAASLRFANGALGSIAATSAAYPGVTTRLEILGDGGSAVIEKDRLAFLHLARDDKQETPLYGGEGKWPPPPGDDTPPVSNGHAQQFADMLDAIQEDRDPLVDGHAGRHAVAIILGIYESARTGKEVRLT